MGRLDEGGRRGRRRWKGRECHDERTAGPCKGPGGQEVSRGVDKDGTVGSNRREQPTWERCGRLAGSIRSGGLDGQVLWDLGRVGGEKRCFSTGGDSHDELDRDET